MIVRLEFLQGREEVLVSLSTGYCPQSQTGSTVLRFSLGSGFCPCLKWSLVEKVRVNSPEVRGVP